MKTAIDQLYKRKQIYTMELAKTTEATDAELANPQSISKERLEEILKFDRYEARLETCNFCLDLLLASQAEAK